MVTTRVSHTKPGISFLQQSACNLILLWPQMVSKPTMKPSHVPSPAHAYSQTTLHSPNQSSPH